MTHLRKERGIAQRPCPALSLLFLPFEGIVFVWHEYEFRMRLEDDGQADIDLNADRAFLFAFPATANLEPRLFPSAGVFGEHETIVRFLSSHMQIPPFNGPSSPYGFCATWQEW